VALISSSWTGGSAPPLQDGLQIGTCIRGAP
jgi:hypothetical protein